MQSRLAAATMTDSRAAHDADGAQGAGRAQAGRVWPRMEIADVPRVLRWGAGLALALGLMLRLDAIRSNMAFMGSWCDGADYWDLAKNLARGWGLVTTDGVCGLPPGPSHHFSPLWPAVESLFIRALGPELATAQVAAFSMSLGMVAIVYWTTRDLFGDGAALLVAAAQSLEWSSMYFGSLNFAENLLIAMLALTLWALLRSVRDGPRWTVAAGAFAGLGYLTKAEMSYFFLLAIAGGVAWRLLHGGRRALFNRHYALGALAFLAFFVPWSVRNLWLFWDGTAAGLVESWQTAPLIGDMIQSAAGRPVAWMRATAEIVPVTVLGVAVSTLPLLPSLRLARLRVRDEGLSLLWISAAVLVFIGLAMAGVFRLVEHRGAFWGAQMRFLAPALVLVWWSVVGFGGPVATRRWAVVFALNLWLALAMPFLVRTIFHERSGA